MPATLDKPEATSDPTRAFAARFNDPSQWKIVRNVPIFAERDERDPETGEVEKIDRAELQRYVDNCNQLVATGNPPGLTLGHTKDDAPEDEQPPSVGWARNFRLAKNSLTGLWTVYQDEYFEPAWYAKVKTYPYRSVERWKVSKIFKPIALLRREPQINLGVVSYQGREQVVRYSRETYMADAPAKLSAPAAAAAPATPHNSDQLTPEEAKLADKFMKHYATNHPVIKYMHQQYEAAQVPPPPGGAPPPGTAPGQYAAPGGAKGNAAMWAQVDDAGEGHRNKSGEYKDMDSEWHTSMNKHYAAPAALSGTNGGPPAPAAPEKAEPYGKTGDVVRYAALERDVAALKAEVARERIGRAEAEQRARVARYSRELSDLERIGYQFDPNEELKDCEHLDEVAFEKHKERIVRRYARVPVGDFVPVAETTPRHKTDEERFEKTLQELRTGKTNDFYAAYQANGK